jgi:hypothetical protein
MRRFVSCVSGKNKETFFGVGGGCRFLVLSSLTVFVGSFSDKTTKKWLHFSHLTNRVDAVY